MESDRLSRRSVLTGAASALVAAPASTLASVIELQEVCDVVIVGAGLSGLVAARNLAAARLSLKVLEASDHVGGRMIKKDVAGGVVDLGGQWVCAKKERKEEQKQPRINTLLDSLKIDRFEGYHGGMTTLVWNGQKHFFAGSFPPFKGQPPLIDPGDVAEARLVWGRLIAIASTVPKAAPWKAPGAQALDSMTIQAWLGGQTSSAFAKWVVGMMGRVGASGAFEPDAASILHMAWTQSQGPQSDNPEAALLAGGAGQVPPKLASGLGGRIVLNAPVTRIEYHPTYVVVHAAGKTYRCKAAIVAIPPYLVSKIEFLPDLPPDRKRLQEGMPMGSLIKVHGIYDTAFWRNGTPPLNGSGTGNLRTCEFTADSSPPSGKPGILTSFIAGKRAEEMAGLTKEERRKEVEAEYVRYFGPGAGKTTGYEEKVWPKEPWVGGAFTSYAKPGVWTQVGEQLRRPFGRRVFWAGSEVATQWAGYFEGAVEAGQEAAKAAFRLVSSERTG